MPPCSCMQSWMTSGPCRPAYDLAAAAQTLASAACSPTARAARAVGEQAADAIVWAAAAKSYAGRHGPEVIQDCMQLHGGIGVTFEHDLHLFLRRAATDAQLYGTPD